jgi:hypothetical protein
MLITWTIDPGNAAGFKLIQDESPLGGGALLHFVLVAIRDRDQEYKEVKKFVSPTLSHPVVRAYQNE